MSPNPALLLFPRGWLLSCGRSTAAPHGAAGVRAFAVDRVCRQANLTEWLLDRAMAMFEFASTTTRARSVSCRPKSHSPGAKQISHKCGTTKNHLGTVLWHFRISRLQGFQSLVGYLANSGSFGPCNNTVPLFIRVDPT